MIRAEAPQERRSDSGSRKGARVPQPDPAVSHAHDWQVASPHVAGGLSVLLMLVCRSFPV